MEASQRSLPEASSRSDSRNIGSASSSETKDLKANCIDRSGFFPWRELKTRAFETSVPRGTLVSYKPLAHGAKTSETTRLNPSRVVDPHALAMLRGI